jgi:hypothetical protein
MKRIAFTILAIATSGACIGKTLTVAPVTVEPIHLTIDVNVHDQRDATRPGKP